MARTESAAIGQLATLLRGPAGVTAVAGQLARAGNLTFSPPEAGIEVLEQFVTAELADKSINGRYPVIHVYCDKVTNTLREKFRTFSGTANLNVDVRVTHDHLSGLQEQLQTYVQAVTDVLERQRGDWGSGVYYTGGYEIAFTPVRKGGKNYTQSAVVRLEVNISVP